MFQDNIPVTTQPLEWRCVESREYKDNKRLCYGRFTLGPLMKGQADTIGIAMRRALLGEIEGTCITHAKFGQIRHDYSTLTGIKESVHDILMNLKEIVLRSNLYGTCEASICVRGPGDVTAQDIILPPYVEIIDNTQHIATLTDPIELVIGLQIEKNRGYRITTNTFQDESYSINPVFMPVRNANHSIHSFGNGNDKKEILFLEIWTNGSLTPKEALHEASRNLIDLFIPFFYENSDEEYDFYEDFYDELDEALDEDLAEDYIDTEDSLLVSLFSNSYTLKLTTNKIMPLESIFIDQSELPPRIYNCLKRSNIHTLLDLLNKSKRDLMKMEHFRLEDLNQLLVILKKNFVIDLPKNKF
nr:RNA polymerase alpha subunit [Schlechtendalia luzulifolia]